MLKSHQDDKENWQKDCICVAHIKSAENAENFSRKISRAPLGGIQNVVCSNQYLRVAGQNVTLRRSKSTSETHTNVNPTAGNRNSLVHEFSPATLPTQRHSQNQNAAKIVATSENSRPQLKQPLTQQTVTAPKKLTVRPRSVSAFPPVPVPTVSAYPPPPRTKNFICNNYDCPVRLGIRKETELLNAKRIFEHVAKERRSIPLSTDPHCRQTKKPHIQQLSRGEGHYNETPENIAHRRSQQNHDHFEQKNLHIQKFAREDATKHYHKPQERLDRASHTGAQDTEQLYVQFEHHTQKQAQNPQNIQNLAREKSPNVCYETQNRFEHKSQNTHYNNQNTISSSEFNTAKIYNSGDFTITYSEKSNSFENSTTITESNNTLSQSKKEFVHYLLEKNNIYRYDQTENTSNIIPQCRAFNNTNNYTTSYINANKSSNSTISTTFACNINESNIESSISPHIAKCVVNKQVAHIRGPIVVVNDQPFVDGQRFFTEEPNIPIQSEKEPSPLCFNLPSLQSNQLNLNSACVRRPSLKNSLKRGNNTRQENKRLLFSLEYAENIIRYLKCIENNLLLNTTIVDQLVHKNHRTAFVNWLMSLAQAKTPNNDPVFFVALRLFDWSIVRLKLRENNYKLAVVISYWIATKYLTNAEFRVPKIFAWLNGKYTKMEILSMEVSILKYLNFNLQMADPLDFLNYYLKVLNFDRDKHLEYSAQFVIECSTLYENYMVTEPSFLANSALCLAYKALCPTSEPLYLGNGHNIEKLRRYANEVLTVNIKYTLLKKYEPVAKYASVEKLNVVQYFTNML